jgi:MinD-like ATPase involved in chromosome partitioning or flagellar assembly
VPVVSIDEAFCCLAFKWWTGDYGAGRQAAETFSEAIGGLRVKVHLVGRLPGSIDLDIVAPEAADAVVVGGEKDELLNLCDDIPFCGKPVFFISSFTPEEKSELSGLGIEGYTPEEFAMKVGDCKCPEQAGPVAPPGGRDCGMVRAERLQPAGGKIVVIGSNKGGVGKTFVSVNAAVAMALGGAKVALVEFDGEKDDIILGAHLIKIPELTVMNYLPHAGPAEHPFIKNLFVIPYGKQKKAGFGGRMTEDYGRKILASLRQSHDYVLVDTGIFADLWCLDSALAAADTLVLVADISRECVSRFISFTNRHKLVLDKHLIINRFTSGAGYYSPSDVAGALFFDQYFVVPEDPAVAALAKKRAFPVMSGASSGKAMTKAFGNIFGISSKRERAGPFAKIFSKFFKGGR